MISYKEPVMQLPTLFYGRYRDVKRDVDHIIRRIVRGDDWIAAVEKEGFVDVEATPGLIVFRGPSAILGSEPHFQIWLLWSRMLDRQKNVRSEFIQRMFEQSLTRPWATLGLVASGNDFWLVPRERFRPFLQAIREYWDAYAAVGARYTDGVDWGEELWKLPNTVGYVLANLRIPDEVLDAPLPPGGITDLIDQTEGVEPIVHPLPGT